MSYTIQRTWHYGSDRHVEEFAADTIEEALGLAMESPDTAPDWAYTDALGAVSDGEVYDGWSWYRFELVTQ